MTDSDEKRKFSYYMHPERRAMYCPICGALIAEKGTDVHTRPPESSRSGGLRFDHSEDWLTLATLLYLDNQGGLIPNKTGLSVLSVSATKKPGPYFLVGQDTPPRLVFVNHPGAVTSVLRYKPLLLFPLHAGCFNIVEDVATLRINVDRGGWLHRVWQVMFVRWRFSIKGCVTPPPRIWEPRGWYGLATYQRMRWEMTDNGESVVRSDFFGNSTHILININYAFQADPVSIPDLTPKLVANLRPLPSKALSSESSSSITYLPIELVRAILGYLQPFPDQFETCTYILPSVHWKVALLEGSLIPWLPKLDANIVEEKEKIARAEGIEWDWEDLVRRLVNLPFRNGSRELSERWSLNIPDGLWNRRRIWQLADDLLAEEMNENQAF